MNVSQQVVEALLDENYPPRQNRFNPKGLRRNHRGQLLDKWGREMEPDWTEFDKRRGKQANPLHNATGTKKP